jgi:hypothetical protein
LLYDAVAGETRPRIAAETRQQSIISAIFPTEAGLALATGTPLAIPAAAFGDNIGIVSVEAIGQATTIVATQAADRERMIDVFRSP